jgi:hypothetical protein
VSITEQHAGPDVVWLMPPDVDPGQDEEHGLSDGKRMGWIDVDVPAIRWRDWEWTAKMKHGWKATLIRIAGGDEFADQWYVFPAPIRADRFVGHGVVEHQHVWGTTPRDGMFVCVRCGTRESNPFTSEEMTR